MRNNVARVETTVNRNHIAIVGSMLGVSHREWRRMSKQFRTCRHAWRILMLNRFTSHLHCGHYCLAWWSHDGFWCWTALHLTYTAVTTVTVWPGGLAGVGAWPKDGTEGWMAKLRLKPFDMREFSQRPSFSPLPSTGTTDEISRANRSVHHLVHQWIWPRWRALDRRSW